MIKPLITIRKSTLLPLKWWMKRKKQASLIAYPPVSLLLEKSDDIRTAYLEAERCGDKEKMSYLSGSSSIIDWIVNYGDSISDKS